MKIQRLLADDTGGDPMGPLKWCRTTPAKMARVFRKAGVQVSASTVRRQLKKLGYSLRVNHKKVESGVKNPPKPKERDRQFDYLSDQRESFARQGHPIISVDTKKKDLIGNFKNGGYAWREKSIPVYDHDFPSDALGRMAPYGIYDTQANRGFMCVGVSPQPSRWTRSSAGGWKKATSAIRAPQTC